MAVAVHEGLWGSTMYLTCHTLTLHASWPDMYELWSVVLAANVCASATSLQHTVDANAAHMRPMREPHVSLTHRAQTYDLRAPSTNLVLLSTVVTGSQKPCSPHHVLLNVYTLQSNNAERHPKTLTQSPRRTGRRHSMLPTHLR